MKYKLSVLVAFFAIAFSSSVFCQSETSEPESYRSGSIIRSGRESHNYRLSKNHVYFGFFSMKNFKDRNIWRSLKREDGTVVAEYACLNDFENIKKVKKNTGRYVGFKYRLEEKGDCVRQLYKVNGYNAEYNRRIIVDLSKVYTDLNKKSFHLAKHIQKSGIFLRTIFNRAERNHNPEVHSVTKIGYRSYQMFYLSYRYSNVPAESPYFGKAKGEHYVSVIDKNAAALKIRLDMINRAKKSIEFVTYIYEPDKSGRLFSQALARKAQAGIKVKVIIDRVPFGFEMTDKYTTAMQKAGIEVKLHNDNFWKISPWQTRNHQKILIVDGKEMITGGRNIADGYFGLNTEYHYVDRDVWIFGPVAKVAQNLFYEFWNNNISESPDQTRKYKTHFLVENSEDRATLAKINEIGSAQLDEMPTVKTSSATFVSDRPGGNDDYTRVVSHGLYNWLRNVKGEVLVESPYFLMMKEGNELLKDILDKGISTSIVTNSRYSISTGHVPIAYILEKLNKYHVKNGVKIYGYSGLPMPDEKLVAELKEKASNELHGKSLIMGNDVFVGTYNLDPRSKYFNVECGVFFENEPDLAALMNYSYMRIIMNSLKMKKNGNYEDSPILAEIKARRSGIVDHPWLSLKATFLDLIGRGLL